MKKHDERLLFDYLFNVIVIVLVNDMSSKDGYHYVSRLDILTQKSLRYKHHRENYVESFHQEIISLGVKLEKKLEILPVFFDFD